MAGALRLSITRISGPFDWSWQLAGAGKAIEGDVRIASADINWHLIADPLARSSAIPLPGLRERIYRALVAVIGNELANAIVDSRPEKLDIVATRHAYPALCLPYEVLFDDQPDQALVTRVVRSENQAIRLSSSSSGSVLAAFPLVAGTPYLPLHREASIIAEISARAEIDYEELFITFTADELLDLGSSGRRIVHLAGHGSEAGFGCMWTDTGRARVISGETLANAWKDKPPALIVLNFCDSASETDISGLVSQTSVSPLRSLAQFMQSVDDAFPPSSSMALELAHRLGSTVVAFRTPVEDTQARQFVSHLYRGLMLEGLSISTAFLRAVQRSSFYDSAGLPVPVLWRGSEQHSEVYPAHKEIRISPSRQPAIYRRDINLVYNALSLLAPAIGNCRFRIYGADYDFMSELSKAIEWQWSNLTRLHPSKYRRGRITQSGKSTQRQRELRTSTSTPGPSGLALINTGELPPDVAWGELQRFSAFTSAYELQLLVAAACGIPSLINGLTVEEVTAAVRRLAEVANGRQLLLDRTLAWDLTLALLTVIPKERRRTIMSWSDASWRILEACGPIAVDVVASRFLQGSSDYFSLDKTLEALRYYQWAAQVESGATTSVLQSLIKDGIVGIQATSSNSTDGAIIDIDLLVATRAWAHCSAAAEEAYTYRFIQPYASLWQEADYITSVSDEELLAMVTMARVAKHDCFAVLMRELQLRQGDADDTSPPPDNLDYRGSSAPAAAENPVAPASKHRNLPVYAQAYVTPSARVTSEGAELDELEVLLAAARNLLQDEHDFEPEALKERALAIESKLSRHLSEGSDKGPIFGGLLHVRQCIAHAQELSGDQDEAAALLVAHFRETQGDGNAIEAVNAAVVAMRFLKRMGRPDHATQIADEVRALASGLPACSASISYYTEDAILRVLIGLIGVAEATVDRLVSKLAAWRFPQPELLADAAMICTAIYSRTRPALAPVFWALSYLCENDQSMRASLGDEVARGLRATVKDRTDCVIAARELYGQIERTLHTLAIDEGMLLGTMESFLAELADIDDVEAREREMMLGGREGVERLSRRAENGCVLAHAMLVAARLPDVLIPPKPADPTAYMYSITDPIGLIDISPHHSDKFRAGLPILRHAFNGDAASKWAWYGLLQNDLSQAELPAWTRLFIALAGGCSWSNAIALLEQITDLEDALSAAQCIEACFNPEETRFHPAQPDSVFLADLGLNAWRNTLADYKRDIGHSTVLYRALDGILGIGEELSAGGERAERLLKEARLHVQDRSYSWILQELQPQRTALFCASVAGAKLGRERHFANAISELMPDAIAEVSYTIVDDALNLLKPLDEVLWKRAIRDVASEIGLDDGARQISTEILIVISNAALESGEIEAARDVTRVLVERGADQLDDVTRLSIWHNYFQILMVVNRQEEAIGFLEASGLTAGITYCCWVVSSWLDVTGSGSEWDNRLAAVVRRVAETSTVDHMEEMVAVFGENFLRLTAGSVEWEPVRARISEALGTS